MSGRFQPTAYRPIIVFRYHDNLLIVQQRIRLLRGLNPGIPIYGLYGGQGADLQQAASWFDGHTELALLPGLAYRNSDLALLEWYRVCGRHLDFTHMYVCEWDLVYAAPLNDVLPLPKPGQSLLTGYIPLALVEWKWDWTNGKKLGPLHEWLEMKRFVGYKHHHVGPYFACIGPGAVLSREFFECYERLELPLLCHDELRYPLIHAIGKLAVGDTGLYPPDWYQPESEAWVRRFNVRRWEVEPKAVQAGVKAGHQAFHPVTKLLDERLLKRLISRYNSLDSAPLVDGS